MGTPRNPVFLIGSIILHVVVLLALVLGFEFQTPLPVIQNTNKNDIISAVILGDSPDSKVLPTAPPIIKPVEKEPPKEIPKPKAKPQPPPPAKPNVLAIKSDVEKKLLEHKKEDIKQDKLKADKLKNELLADIKKLNKKQKTEKQKELKSHFEKTLKAQTERTMRQLLDDELMIKGKENRQSQGEVNKYKALILQAISEQWIVPTQSNRKLYCELKIRLAPSGLVLDVVITKTSGDPALDRSARAAVLKASPLPVPKEKVNFDPFSEFVLKVKPENLLTSNVGR